MARLTDTAIDVVALASAGAREDCGAVVVFLGTTRDHHAGRRVLELAYEAYPRMAEPALERLERLACERYPIASCSIVHRLGVVPVREASVAVVVQAAHRAAAFDAAQWVMDELKRTVPIWKRERFAGGDEAWVEGRKLGEG